MKILNQADGKTYTFPDDAQDAEVQDFFLRNSPETRSAFVAAQGGNEAAMPIVRQISAEAARLSQKRKNESSFDLVNDPANQLGGALTQTIPNVAQAIGGIYESMVDANPARKVKDIERRMGVPQMKKAESPMRDMMAGEGGAVATDFSFKPKFADDRTFSLSKEEQAEFESLKTLPVKDELHVNRLKELEIRQAETRKAMEAVEVEYREAEKELNTNNALLQWGLDASRDIRQLTDARTSVAGSMNPEDGFGDLVTSPRKLTTIAGQGVGTILSVLAAKAVAGPAGGLAASYSMATGEVRAQIDMFKPEWTEAERNNFAQVLAVPGAALEYVGAMGTLAKTGTDVSKKLLVNGMEANAGILLSPEAIARLSGSAFGKRALVALSSPVGMSVKKTVGALAPEVGTELTQETLYSRAIQGEFPTLEEYMITTVATAASVGAFAGARAGGRSLLDAATKQERMDAFGALDPELRAKNKMFGFKYAAGKATPEEVAKFQADNGLTIIKEDGSPRGFDIRTTRAPENAEARLREASTIDPLLGSFFFSLGEKAATEGVFGQFAKGEMIYSEFLGRFQRAVQFGDFEGFTGLEKHVIKQAVNSGAFIANPARVSTLAERKMSTDKALPIFNALRSTGYSEKDTLVALETAELLLYNIATNTVIPETKGTEQETRFNTVEDYLNHPETAIDFAAVTEAAQNATRPQPKVENDQEAAKQEPIDADIIAGRFDWRSGDADLIALTLGTANPSTLVHELQHLAISRLDGKSVLAEQLVRFLNNQQDDYLIQDFSELTDISTPEKAAKSRKLQEIAAEYTEVFIAADLPGTRKDMSKPDVAMFKAIGSQIRKLYNFSSKLGAAFENLEPNAKIADATAYAKKREDRNAYFSFLLNGGTAPGAFTTRQALRMQEEINQKLNNATATVEVDLPVYGPATSLSVPVGPEQGPISPLDPPAVTDADAAATGNRIVRQAVTVHFAQEPYSKLYKLPELLRTTGFDDVEGEVLNVDDKAAAARHKQNTITLRQLAEELGIPVPQTRNLSSKKRDQARREFISKMLAVHKAYKELVDARTADNAARPGREMQFHLNAPLVDGELLSAAAEAGGIDLVDFNYYQTSKRAAKPRPIQDEGRELLIQQNWRYFGPKMGLETVRAQVKSNDEELLMKQLEKRLANGQPFDAAVNGMFHMFIDWHSPGMNQTLVELLGRAAGMQKALPIIEDGRPEVGPFYQTVKVGQLLKGTKVVDSRNGLPKKVYPYGIFWAENTQLDGVILDKESAAYLDIKNPIGQNFRDIDQPIILDIISQAYDELIINKVRPEIEAKVKAGYPITAQEEFITEQLKIAAETRNLDALIKYLFNAYKEAGIHFDSPAAIMLHHGVDGIRYTDSRTSTMWRPMDPTKQLFYVEDFEQHAETVVPDFEVLPQVKREAGLKRVLAGTKAVDERGVPVETFHATRTPGFNEHDARYIEKGAGGDPFGFWYTESMTEALRYLNHYLGGEGEIRRAYVMLRNPLDMDEASTDKKFLPAFRTAFIKVVENDDMLSDIIDTQFYIDFERKTFEIAEYSNIPSTKDNHVVRDYLKGTLLELQDYLGLTVDPEINAITKQLAEKQLIERTLQKMGYDGATHIGVNDIRKWVHFSNASIVPAHVVETLVAEYTESPQPLFQKVKRKRLDGQDPLNMADVAAEGKILFNNDAEMISIFTKAQKIERLKPEEYAALRMLHLGDIKRFKKLIESGDPVFVGKTVKQWKEELTRIDNTYGSENATMLWMRRDDYKDVLVGLMKKLKKMKGMDPIYYQFLSVMSPEDLVTMNNLKGKTKAQLQELIDKIDAEDFELKGMQKKIVERLTGLLTTGEELDLNKINKELSEFIALNNSNDVLRQIVRASTYGSILFSIPGRTKDMLSSTAQLLWEIGMNEPIDISMDYARSIMTGNARTRSFKELTVNPFKGTFNRKNLSAKEFGAYADAGAIKTAMAVLKGRLSIMQVESRYLNDLHMGGVILAETFEQYGTRGQQFVGSMLALSPRVMSAIDTFYRVSAEEVYAEKMAIRLNMWQEQGTLEQNLRSAAESRGKMLDLKGDKLEAFVKSAMDDPMLLITSLSEEFSSRIVFRQKPGELTALVMQLRNKADDIAGRVPVLGAVEPGRMLVRFIPTLVNVLKTAASITPAGASLLTVDPVLKSFFAGAGVLGALTQNSGMDAKRKAMVYARNQIAANTALYFMYWAVSNGLLTALPWDDDERRAWEDDPTGKIPLAFKVKSETFGIDTWVPIPSPLDVAFGPALMAVREHIERSKRDLTFEEHEALAGKAMQAAMYFVKNNMFFTESMSFLSGDVEKFNVSRAVESYVPFNAMLRDISKWTYVDNKKDSELFARLGWRENLALIPTVITDRVLGPDAAAYIGTHTNHYLSMMGREIPGLENGIPDKLNYMGKEIERHKFLGIGMPWEWFAESPDLTTLPWEAEWKGLGIYPDTPSQNMQIDGTTYRLPPDVYRDFTLKSGELLVARYNQILASPAYQRLTDEQKVGYFDKTYREVKTAAKNQIVAFHRLNTPEGKRKMRKVSTPDPQLPI